MTPCWVAAIATIDRPSSPRPRRWSSSRTIGAVSRPSLGMGAWWPPKRHGWANVWVETPTEGGQRRSRDRAFPLGAAVVVRRPVAGYRGARQVVAHAQRANPLRWGSGADGVPMTLPLVVVSRIRSAALSWAAARLTFARSNVVRDSLGRSARPALVPITIGVSSIHSAVA